MRSWGVRVPAAEADAFLHSWQVAAHMLGVEDAYIPATWEAAYAQAPEVLDPVIAPTPEGVELAHGAAEAKRAQTAHQEAFSHGTNTFSLGAIRNALGTADPNAGLGAQKQKTSDFDKQLLEYKRAYAASSIVQPSSGTAASTQSQPKQDTVVTLPLSMLGPGAFPRILHDDKYGEAARQRAGTDAGTGSGAATLPAFSRSAALSRTSLRCSAACRCRAS